MQLQLKNIIIWIQSTNLQIILSRTLTRSLRHVESTCFWYMPDWLLNKAKWQMFFILEQFKLLKQILKLIGYVSNGISTWQDSTRATITLFLTIYAPVNVCVGRNHALWADETALAAFQVDGGWATPQHAEILIPKAAGTRGPWVVFGQYMQKSVKVQSMRIVLHLSNIWVKKGLFGWEPPQHCFYKEPLTFSQSGQVMLMYIFTCT